MEQSKLEINLPEWMKASEQYSPKKDKSGFIEKSLLKFFKLFRHFHVEKNEGLSVYRAGNRTVMLLGLIILLGLSQKLFFCGTIAAGFLILLCFSKIDILKRTLSISLSAGLFTFIILLPSYFMNKSGNFIFITFKVFLSTGMISFYSQNTPWNKITASLRMIKIPYFLIFILDITLHYILILGNLAFNMLNSLKLRSVGKNPNKKNSFSGIPGTVFLKSLSVSEETQQAMECRLFNGGYVYSKTKISIKDFFPIFIFIFYMVLFIFVS